MNGGPGSGADAGAAGGAQGLSYAGLLRIPGARRFVLPAVVGRLPQAMFGVGTVLLVEGYRGSYALAGAVGAVLALSGGLIAPVLGRLADRFGQSIVAVCGTAVHVPALVALVLATVGGVPAWGLFALAALIGATTPILGAFARVRWRALTGGGAGADDGSWDRALALESVVDEVTFVVGPSLAAVLATQVSPGLPLVVAAGLTLVGVVGFVSARATEPPPGRDAGPARRGRPAVLEAGMPLLVLVAFCLGVVFGGTEVAIVAFTDERGVPVAAGILVSLFSAASLVAGLAYGARTWTSAPHTRLAVVAVAFGIAALVVPWAGTVWALGAGLVLLGLAVAPTLIAINAVAALLVRPAALTEGFTWVVVLLLAGVAGGAAGAGAIVDARGADTALWLTAAAGVGVLGSGLLAARTAARVAGARSHSELLTGNMTRTDAATDAATDPATQ